MGLHFFGFKICSMILIAMGINVQLAQLTAPSHNNIYCLFLYLLFGVFTPLGFMWCVRMTKKGFALIIKKQND